MVADISPCVKSIGRLHTGEPERKWPTTKRPGGRGKGRGGGVREGLLG